MNIKTSNKAVLYVRAGQAHPCAEMGEQLMLEAASQGMEVVGKYVDAGCSGSSSRNCPQLLKMLADAKAGLFAHLFVSDLSRLSRSKELWELIAELRGYGVSVHVVENGVVV